MNLLPKSKTEFSELNYWEKFFKNRTKSFEWYGEYINLIDIFNKYVKSQDSTLISGCGNSTLSYDLHIKQNCSKVVSIDISKTVIDQMLSKYQKTISRINDKKEKIFDFKCLNVCNFSKDEEIRSLLPINCVIDKGTTDAIHTGENSNEVIKSMWTEIERNLSLMGKYVLITLAQSHIVDSIAEFFLKPESNQWMINVHEIINAEQDKSFALPVFVFVFYKMKQGPSLPLVYVEESCILKKSKVSNTRLKNPVTDLKHWISVRQQLSMLSNSIQKSKESESVINMVSPESGLTRYHCIFVSDRMCSKRKFSPNQLVYCVFIVPFAFNNSPLVNSTEARLKMCRDHLKCRECLFVFLNGREFYSDRQQIQDELKSVAVKFCPNDVTSDYSIPFVSCHDNVYNSSTVTVANTEGDWILESIDTAFGETCNRLIFARNKSITVSTHPLTLHDQMVLDCLEKLAAKVVTSKGVFCGRLFGTKQLQTFGNRLMTNVPGLDSKTLLMIEDKFSVNCIIADKENCKDIDWALIDIDVVDENVVKTITDSLSNLGVIVLYCSESRDLEAIVSRSISLSENFIVTSEDPFGGDKKKFAVLSKNSDDISSLQSVFSGL